MPDRSTENSVSVNSFVNRRVREIEDAMRADIISRLGYSGTLSCESQAQRFDERDFNSVVDSLCSGRRLIDLTSRWEFMQV